VKCRPWAIIILGYLHILYPIISLLVIDIVLSGTPEFLFSEFYAGWRSVMFFTLIPLGGVAILAMKQWSYPFVLLAWGINFYTTVIDYGEAPSTRMIGLTALQNLLGLVVVMYFLIPNVKSVYYNPRVRWWEHKPRYFFNLPCKVSVGDAIHEARILDISHGGVFINAPLDVNLSSKIKVLLEDERENLEIEGTVVHRRKEADDAGYGIQFSRLDSKTKKWLRDRITTLEKDGEIKLARMPNVRTFGQWLKSLLTTGRGLIPKGEN